MSNMSEYYDWLMKIIDGPYRYSRVLNDLWNIEFYSVIPNDDNRAADGIDMRSQYEYETGDVCDKTGPCTVLEMMIGLSVRMENDYMYDPKFGNRTDIWFWEMFESLGLDQYGGRMYKRDEVREVIFDFLDRNGTHFLFPKPSNGGQWSEMEIWWQMNKYILDRYS